MKHIEAYSSILRIRSKFKRMQQLSWNISQLEKAYPIDGLHQKDFEPLYEAYQSLIGELSVIYDELKDEREIHADRE